MVSQEGACPSSCRSAILGAGSRPRTNLRSDDSLAETCRVQSRIVRGRNSRTELGATQGPTRLCVRGRRREVCAASLPVDQNTCDRRAGAFGRSFGGADAMDGLRGGVAGVRHPNGARFPRRLAVWAVSLAGGVWGLGTRLDLGVVNRTNRVARCLEQFEHKFDMADPGDEYPEPKDRTQEQRGQHANNPIAAGTTSQLG